jgi:4-amino-4-deoxy-L-arabinose transferase-like glycosyltransferase
MRSPKVASPQYMNWHLNFSARLSITTQQLALLLVGLLLSIAASIWASYDSNISPRIDLALWLLGITLVVVSLRTEKSSTQERAVSSWEIIALILILSLGWIVRVIRIESMPYVLSGDEGSAGLVAWEFLEGSRENILGLGWFSFPALYFWLLSLGQSLYGRTVEAIRLASALVGTLTLAATYLAGKLMFNRKVGLIAAAWLATFHFHIFFSRVAYNNIFDGLFLILAVALLFRGWRSHQRDDFLLFGLTLGFSQYFYTTSHALPLILLLWVPWLHKRLSPFRSHRTNLLTALLVAGCVALPLVVTYASNPSSLTFTTGRVSLLDPSLLRPAAEAFGTTPLGLVGEQILVTGLGLTVSELQGIYVDTGKPMLFGLSAIVFSLGLLLSLIRWRRPGSAILLLSLAASILIGGLSIQAPSSQRLILLPAILALLCADALVTGQMWLKDRLPRLRLVSLFLILGLLGWMMYENIDQLFWKYFPVETYGSLNGEVTQEMVEFLQGESKEVKIYFMGGERMQFDSIPSLAYLLPGYTAESLETVDDLPPHSSISQRTLIIALPEEQALLSQLSSIHPESSTIARYNRHGRLLFYVRIIDPPD